MALDKKTAAKSLFNEGFAQNEIAALLNVQPKTISTWAQTGNWREKRTENLLARETAEERVWKLINFQLNVLSLITAKMEESVDESSDLPSLQKALISKGDIDALQKLFTTIKGKEMDWSQTVKCIREFVEYVEQQDLDIAKKVAQMATMYLNDKRKEE